MVKLTVKLMVMVMVKLMVMIMMRAAMVTVSVMKIENLA